MDIGSLVSGIMSSAGKGATTGAASGSADGASAGDIIGAGMSAAGDKMKSNASGSTYQALFSAPQTQQIQSAAPISTPTQIQPLTPPAPIAAPQAKAMPQMPMAPQIPQGMPLQMPNLNQAQPGQLGAMSVSDKNAKHKINNATEELDNFLIKVYNNVTKRKM